MPPPGTSHMQPATTPPGRVTRAISRMPGRRVAHERDDERAQRDVERAVLEGQLLGDAHAHVGARVARPAGVGELRGGVDRGDVVRADARDASSRVSPPGPQPTSSARMPAAHPGGVGELRRQPRDVAAHEAVVVLGGSGELHPPSQPPPRAPRQAVRSADAHDGGPRDGGGPAPRPGRGAREGAQLPHAGRLQPADLVGAQHALQDRAARPAPPSSARSASASARPAASGASGCPATRSRASGGA